MVRVGKSNRLRAASILSRRQPAEKQSAAARTRPLVGRHILGIDPGLNTTGYGVLLIDGTTCRVVEAGVVRSRQHATLAERVQSIHEGIAEVLDGFQPSVVALEELYSHYQRPRTAILMGHARGVICLAAATRNVPVVGYAATQVKRILTGSGRAPKPQMQQAIQRELQLREPPQPPDVADALAIGLTHFYLGREPANLVPKD